MPELIAHDFPADTAALAEVRALVREACRLAGCDQAATEDWVLAANEACMNVIQHAYRFAPGQAFRVEATSDDGEFVLTICDNGTPASIADLQPRPLDEIRPGGLGVHFIRELTDTMTYLPPGNGWQNRLRLGRQLA